MIEQGPFGTGVLTFKDVEIPDLILPGGAWSTSIWINVYSQCPQECGVGYWWKFEKQLSASEAFTFASGNNNPTFAPSDVNGESVDLQFMGQVPCNYWDTYLWMLNLFTFLFLGSGSGHLDSMSNVKIGFEI